MPAGGVLAPFWAKTPKISLKKGKKGSLPVKKIPDHVYSSFFGNSFVFGMSANVTGPKNTGFQHELAYRKNRSSEGFLIYTVFSKKCQKRSKRGYPPLFGPHCGNLAPYQVPPPTSDWALGGRFSPRGFIPRGGNRTSRRIFGVGVPSRALDYKNPSF